MIHQIATKTAPERYPDIFSCLESLVRPKSRILSFGCSTGEEIDSLSRHCKRSKVFGCEVNRHCLAVLSGRKDKDRIFTFADLEKSDLMFDCITAFSVLCRWPSTKGKEDISKIYRFEGFDSTVSWLDSKLNSGGLLVIYNSNYRMADTAVYKNYTVLSCAGLHDAGEMDHFSREGKPLPEKYMEVFFRKN